MRYATVQPQYMRHAIAWDINGDACMIFEGDRRYWSKRALKRMCRWESTARITIHNGPFIGENTARAELTARQEKR